MLLYVFIILIGILCLSVYFYFYKIEEVKWNNGYCSICSNKWKLYHIGKVGERYYTCKLGHNIKIEGTADKDYMKNYKGELS